MDSLTANAVRGFATPEKGSFWTKKAFITEIGCDVLYQATCIGHTYSKFEQN